MKHSIAIVFAAFVLQGCAPGGECYTGPYSSIASYGACLAAQSVVENPDTRGTGAENKIVDEKLLTKASNGDPEAQYALASDIGVADPRAAWRWNCKAAMQSHRMAQSRMASMYRWGLEPVSENPAKAFMWYALAASEGEPQLVNMRDRYAEDLTPLELTQGNYLLEHWQPGECHVPVDRS